MTVADRIAVMDKGKIVQIAPPAEMYEQPNSRYVADFIGDVSVFEGKVVGVEDGLVRVASDEAGGELVVQCEEHPSPGTQVWLAVRPEKMRLFAADTPPPAGGVNSVSGTVFDIGYLGDWTTYVIELPSAQKIKVARANETRTVEKPISWEDPVNVCFAPDAAVLLTR
jgi:putrescine transport system ATP-binding protein